MNTTPTPTDLPPRGSVDSTHFDESLHGAIDHAHGTDDPVYAPAPHPALFMGAARQAVDHLWLPDGYHFGLHIEHRPVETAGPYTGGGNKWVWHITVSPWGSVDAMYQVLKAKRAAPHLVIGGRPGVKNPVVIQMIPFDQAGRALEHPGGPETNRADAVQVEICANVDDVPRFSERQYRAFANLVRLTNLTMESRRDVPRKLARRFEDGRHFGGQEFVNVSGHCGHMHVPNNTHIDPTKAFKGSHLLGLLDQMPHDGYRL